MPSHSLVVTLDDLNLEQSAQVVRAEGLQSDEVLYGRLATYSPFKPSEQ